MLKSDAQNLYKENWKKEFTSMENLYKRIKVLAENGAYSLCVYIDSKKTYDEVSFNLKSNGFSVEDYNGGNNNILEVSW